MAPHTRIRQLNTKLSRPVHMKRAMYGSQQQQQGRDADEQQRLLPSYSPAGMRMEQGGDGAHMASAWPATFETGVETM